jgi:hypothetical protein
MRSPTTLTSPNAQTLGDFGSSIAISGGTTKLVAVGAPNEASGGFSEAGNVYIFSETSGVLKTTLTSPNAQFDGNFGISVAMSGQLVAVGAWCETVSSQSCAGRAYVFNATSGQLLSALSSPSPTAYGYFGFSVAISGQAVVVGAYCESVAGHECAGRAYVFNATTGSLISKLKSATPQTEGYFGLSVSVSGKLVSVGAWGENGPGLPEAGSAYVFRLKGGLVSTIYSPNAQVDGAFGYSVSISGGIVAVGAPQENFYGNVDGGTSYSFYASSGGLIHQYNSFDDQPYGYFGGSISVTGSLVTVGAPGETLGTNGGGSVYVEALTTGNLVSSFISPNPVNGGYFGSSVSMSGKTVAVGAPYETSAGLTSAGNGYVFYSV